MSGHGPLRGDGWGAAYNTWGERLVLQVPGRAKCRCGRMSEQFLVGPIARTRWLREHMAEMARRRALWTTAAQREHERGPTYEDSKVPGHGLMYKGAAADEFGDRLRYPGKSEGYVGGPGRAACRCGAVSPVVDNQKQRVEWHREHKASVASKEQVAC